MVQQRLVLLDVLGEDFVDQLAVDLLILDRHVPGLEHADDRLAAAPAGTAGLAEDDVVASAGGDVLAELVHHLVGAGRMLAGCRPDLDVDPLPAGPLAVRFFRLGGQGFVLLLNDVVAHSGPCEKARGRRAAPGTGAARQDVYFTTGRRKYNPTLGVCSFGPKGS